MTRWGLVSTIKAPVRDILAFAAHHLDLGAARLYLYLDAPNPEAQEVLQRHPAIRVQVCDDAYWQAAPIKRPKKHQPRQTFNASEAYKTADVDWLTHIDVDEFLWPDHPVADTLAALSADTQTLRVRPMELLSGSDTAYKAWLPPGPDRDRIAARLYPTYGEFLKGGFLSHVAGKVFVRTGMSPITFRIHNVFLGNDMNPGVAESTDMALCHRHALSWEDWHSSYRFRMAQGSYRPELAPNRPHEKGGVKMHDLFAMIESERGEDGLRAFFEEVCAATPRQRAALEKEGLLRICDLSLDAKIAKHFPGI
ncbi:MAG: glycosyltransferase family 2 protein [Paracoccaceae bacterium]